MQAKTIRRLSIKEIILPKDMPVTKAVEYLRWDYLMHIKAAPGLILSEGELLAIYERMYRA